MKAKKLTKEELKSVQDHVGQLNQVYIEIGRLESQKNKVMAQLNDLDKEFLTVQKEIETKYGKVSINIDDGALSELPEENE
tara:strand:+ start:39 stop:281 length:243 start_codon:yes stop_codon:yes gene_type:complete